MKNHTILIVDDEEMVLKTIKRILLGENYNLITARNGREGLAELRCHDVSLVISDQRMPGMTGVEFLEKVKINYPHILTILLTGHAEIATAVKAINEAGVYKFILKPLDPDDFRITLKRALESLDVMKERDFFQQKVKTHSVMLRYLENKYPGITRVEKDENGFVLTLS